METNKRLIALKDLWRKVKRISTGIGTKIYEGVPIDKNWSTYDGFFKDNYYRYYRALVKWKNYKRCIVKPKRGLTGTLKKTPVQFVRKIKSVGFTKENTVFTSCSDAKKFLHRSKKIMFDDKLLGTRDVSNILKKRGINANPDLIAKRIRTGDDIFGVNVKQRVRYKNKFRSLPQIAAMNCISVNALKNHYKISGDIKKAISEAKRWKGFKKYLFESKYLTAREICAILSKRTGVKVDTLAIRFRKYGFDLNKILMRFRSKENSSLVIPVVAEKDGKIVIFRSFKEAATSLNIKPSNISLAVNGKIKQCKGYKFYKDEREKETKEV